MLKEGLTYLKNVDELGVGNVSVLVGVEVVEHYAELLSSEENSKFGHKFLKLKFT